MEWAFSLYDLDNDGQITRDEMLTILNAIQTMLTTDENLEEKVDHIFEKMDLEWIQKRNPSIEDNRISSQGSNFRKLDRSSGESIKDKNGTLSKDEFVLGAKFDSTVIEALSLYSNNYPIS